MSESTRLLSEWIAEGAIGGVGEVHNWSSRPYWPQGVDRPGEEQPAPPGLDWNMWLGPASYRPFHKAYLPFVWRGWYDFGVGSLGDMGCYSLAGIFQILKLTAPVAAEASSSEVHQETYPLASVVHTHYPARGNMPPVRLSWYDGGLKPPRPEALPAGEPFGRGREGVMYVGEKGVIVAGFNGDQPKVFPESKTYIAPPPAPRSSEERGVGPAIERWLAACKGAPVSASSFESQGPVTEALLLGTVALRFPGEEVLWDSAGMKVTNVAAANQYVDPPYRDYSSKS